MPRPLTGSLQQQPSGSWQAGLPVARGATQRHTPTFKKKEDAERWLEAGRRMLQAGRSLPEPDPAAATALHGRSGDADHSDPAFAIVCWWWHNEHYEDQRRAGPERTEQVATILSHHVIPYFDPGGAGLTADEVVRPRDIEQDPYRCIRFLKHLAGCDTEPAAAADGHALPDNRELTIAEATHACGVSRSTIKRQRRKGGLPGSYRDDTDGRVRIPVGDLRSAGLLGGTKGPGLSKTYAAGILWVLRSVFEHAIKYGWMTTDPSKT